MRHNSDMKTNITIYSLAAIFFCSLAQAEPAKNALPWYQVELLIVEPTVAPATNEKWPVVVEEPLLGDSIELKAPSRSQKSAASNPVAFQLLNPKDYYLKGMASRLEKNDANKILLHIAWRQPLEENASSPAIHIHSGLNDFFLSKSELERKSALLVNNTTAVNESGLLTNDIASPVVENVVDGTLILNLTRFLHLKAHLIYTNPEVDLARQISEQETNAPVVQRFLLKESRRVRRKEVHYLDHPYFGVIARVTRFAPK